MSGSATWSLQAEGDCDQGSSDGSVNYIMKLGNLDILQGFLKQKSSWFFRFSQPIGSFLKCHFKNFMIPGWPELQKHNKLTLVVKYTSTTIACELNASCEQKIKHWYQISNNNSRLLYGFGLFGWRVKKWIRLGTIKLSWNTFMNTIRKFKMCLNNSEFTDLSGFAGSHC